MALLVAYLVVALGVSFLCSLLEAALLSVPRSHVAVLVEQGRRVGKRLMRMKDDVDRPLAAILTLNTFAHTLGAAGVGAQAARLWGSAWVGAVSVVVTLLVLVVSEIVPKTLGAVHAKGLAPFTAWTVGGMMIALKPMVSVCDAVSKLLSHRDQAAPKVSRDEVRSLASLALEEGAIDRSESRVIRNLIALRETTVREVMTPRTVVFMLGADETVREATAEEPPRFARIPVVETSLDDVVGLVHRHQLFDALREGRPPARMRDLARPLHAVPELARLRDVLAHFIARREHLFLVVDEYGGAVGIVTLEDVLETLLGEEILDETDRVADMQKLARRLAERVEKTAPVTQILSAC